MSESGSPAKKVEHLSQQNSTKNRKRSACKCDVTKKVDEIKVTFEQQMKEQTNELKSIHGQISVVQDQLKLVAELLAEHKVVIRRLEQQSTQYVPLKNKFPLQNEGDLINMSEEINETNKNAYVKAMISIIGPAGILKNLKFIVSTEVLLDYNMDGTQGKKSLKHVETFYSALLESITVMDENAGSAEEQIRKAVNLQKKRHFKSVSLKKQKQNEPSVLP